MAIAVVAHASQDDEQHGRSFLMHDNPLYHKEYDGRGLGSLRQQGGQRDTEVAARNRSRSVKAAAAGHVQALVSMPHCATSTVHVTPATPCAAGFCEVCCFCIHGSVHLLFEMIAGQYMEVPSVELL